MAAVPATAAVVAATAGFGVLAAIVPAVAAAPPEPTDDAITVVDGSGMVSVDVLANDHDPDGDPLTVTEVSAGTTDGTVVEWDPAGFIGEFVITYSVSGGGDSAEGRLTVTVEAAPGQPPVANDDEAMVTQGSFVVVTVLGNDTDADGDHLMVTDIVSGPAHGGATYDETSVRYEPDPAYLGTDVVTYEISDGQTTAEANITFTVAAVANQSPTAVYDGATTRWDTPVRIDVLANDTDPEGDQLDITETTEPTRGSVEIVNGGLRYEPIGQFVGTATFDYTVSDGRGGTDVGSVSVLVRPLYDAYLTRPGRAVALRPTKVQGRITSRMDGQVDVKVQRQNDAGRWLLVKQVRVGSDDRFSARWVPQQPGREKLRAVAMWQDGPTRASDVLRSEVVAVFDPVVTKVTRKDVPHTWRPGCPVGPSSLRMIRMNYWDYDKRLQRGTLIGASWAVDDYVGIFRRAFADKFLIKKMYPADRYGGVDEKAMRAGNTSAFNCRHVTGNPYRMSRHSWGDAIDINTFENPYVTGSRVYPAAAALKYYYRRSQHLDDPGVITSRSPIAQALFARSWYWGARWSAPDYQHWSRTGA